MMEVLIFTLKVLVVVVGLIAIILAIATVASRASQKSELEVEPLHKKFEELRFFMQSFTSSKAELKQEKKKLKAKAKEQKEKAPGKKVFVLNFEGDIKASAVENLREEISALLQIAKAEDEVVIVLESPGGMVHGYGLAASQLSRVREAGIRLTACVDKVAASGGYMMACVANQIYAAPFAIVGSIGVVAQVPNLHRVLKKYDVDYKEYTAGEYKRTVSLLGEITPKGEEKFVERLNDTHVLFKKFVQAHRPQLNIEKVATGEYWFGTEAKDLGLIDEIKTSDDYLLSLLKAQPDTQIFELTYHKKQALSEKLSELMSQSLVKAGEKALNRLESNKMT